MGIFVDAIKNDLVDYDYGNKDIVTSYKLGDGNHKVTLEGNKTSLKVGNGNSQISVEGDECAVLAGDGDHSISTVGDYNNTITGNGNQTVISYGNSSNIITGDGDSNIAHYGMGGIIRTGEGDKSIVSVGDGKVIQSGSGDDDVLMIGNYNFADFGNGDNNIIFYSGGSVINTGNGNDSITSLDQLIDNEKYSEYEEDLINYLDTRYRKKYTLISAVPIYSYTSRSMFEKETTTVYAVTYDVETFKDKMAGVKNTQINTGGGSDTLSITVAKKTKIKTDKTEKDEVNKKKQYAYSTESLGVERITTYQTETTSSWRGGVIGGTIGAVVGTLVCPGLGTIIGAGAGAYIGKKS